MKIAFFYERPPERMPSYVRNDYEILCGLGEVRWVSPLTGSGWRRGIGPRGWLPSRQVWDAARWCDVAFQWFATPAAAVVAARLSRKPILVVTGGYDVASVPAIGYGRMLLARTRWMGQLTLGLATRVLAVSTFNLGEARRWAPTASLHLCYLGFDAKKFGVGANKLRQVLSVATITADYARRKGLETLAQAARRLHDVQFLLVGPKLDGRAVEDLHRQSEGRLTFPGAMTTDAIARVMQGSRVYAQLSLHEAFGCAVAESMLSGATPVITRAGALPEVVGDCGYYVPESDTAATVDAIRLALDSPRGKAARERIARVFPLDARRLALREHVFSVVSS
jgi:glycosyltransferase involved in cell wall biosynthesis